MRSRRERQGSTSSEPSTTNSPRTRRHLPPPLLPPPPLCLQPFLHPSRPWKPTAEALGDAATGLLMYPFPSLASSSFSSTPLQPAHTFVNSGSKRPRACEGRRGAHRLLGRSIPDPHLRRNERRGDLGKEGRGGETALTTPEGEDLVFSTARTWRELVRSDRTGGSATSLRSLQGEGLGGRADNGDRERRLGCELCDLPYALPFSWRCSGRGNLERATGEKKEIVKLQLETIVVVFSLRWCLSYRPSTVSPSLLLVLALCSWMVFSLPRREKSARSPSSDSLSAETRGWRRKSWTFTERKRDRSGALRGKREGGGERKAGRKREETRSPSSLTTSPYSTSYASNPATDRHVVDQLSDRSTASPTPSRSFPTLVTRVVLARSRLFVRSDDDSSNSSSSRRHGRRAERVWQWIITPGSPLRLSASPSPPSLRLLTSRPSLSPQPVQVSKCVLSPDSPLPSAQPPHHHQQ